MIILGVDPGLLHSGVAVYDTETKKVIHKETIIPKHIPPQNWPGRLRFILGRLGEISQTYKPQKSAVEIVVWHGKRRGALPLAILSGAIAGFMAHYGEIELIVPSKVKETSKGNGDAHQADAIALCVLASKFTSYGVSSKKTLVAS